VLDMINIGVDGCKYDSVVRRLGRLGDKRHGEPQFIGSGIKTLDNQAGNVELQGR